MTDFETGLETLLKESNDLQTAERDLKHKATVFNERMVAFFKEHGLPENFTLPQLAMLAIRKSKEVKA